MIRPVTPKPISTLWEGAPTRRDLAFPIMIFDRDALCASVQSLRHLCIFHYTPLE